MRLMTISELASRLNVSRPRAYQLVRRGALPCVRLIRQVRVSEDALREFIESGGTASGAEPNPGRESA